jgi:hypothetical protein
MWGGEVDWTPEAKVRIAQATKAATAATKTANPSLRSPPAVHVKRERRRPLLDAPPT